MTYQILMKFAAKISKLYRSENSKELDSAIADVIKAIHILARFF